MDRDLFVIVVVVCELFNVFKVINSLGKKVRVYDGRGFERNYFLIVFGRFVFFDRYIV